MAFSKCMNTLSSRNNPPVMEPTNKVDNLTPGIFNSIQTVILVDEFSHLQRQKVNYHSHLINSFYTATMGITLAIYIFICLVNIFALKSC